MKCSPIAAVIQLMGPRWTILYSKWFGGAVLICLVVGTISWFVVQDRLPGTIRIATGAEHGQYYLYGGVLAGSMQTRTARRVIPLITDGSVDNYNHLVRGRADLAIIQKFHR